MMNTHHHQQRGGRDSGRSRPPGIVNRLFHSGGDPLAAAVTCDRIMLESGRVIFTRLSAWSHEAPALSLAEVAGIMLHDDKDAMTGFIPMAVNVPGGDPVVEQRLFPADLGPKDQFAVFSVYYGPTAAVIFAPRTLEDHGVARIPLAKEARVPLINAPSMLFPQFIIPERGVERARAKRCMDAFASVGLDFPIGSGIEPMIRMALSMEDYNAVLGNVAHEAWNSAAEHLRNPDKALAIISHLIGQPLVAGGAVVQLDAKARRIIATTGGKRVDAIPILAAEDFLASRTYGSAAAEIQPIDDVAPIVITTSSAPAAPEVAPTVERRFWMGHPEMHGGKAMLAPESIARQNALEFPGWVFWREGKTSEPQQNGVQIGIISQAEYDAIAAPPMVGTPDLTQQARIEQEQPPQAALETSAPAVAETTTVVETAEEEAQADVTLADMPEFPDSNKGRKKRNAWLALHGLTSAFEAQEQAASAASVDAGPLQVLAKLVPDAAPAAQVEQVIAAEVAVTAEAAAPVVEAAAPVVEAPVNAGPGHVAEAALPMEAIVAPPVEAPVRYFWGYSKAASVNDPTHVRPRKLDEGQAIDFAIAHKDAMFKEHGIDNAAWVSSNDLFAVASTSEEEEPPAPPV